MLNFLSSGNQQQIVGIALTPGIGLEAVILDPTKSAVLNYGRRRVEYNFSTREIQDYVQFKTALVELMDEMKIMPKSLVYVVLPNVFFDFIEVPNETSDPEIKTATLSKAEEFYLFKREEPVSGWCDVANLTGNNQRRIAYSSFQKSCVDEIKEIISDIGLKIVGIENAYSATLRGLYLTGAVDDAILEQASWDVMIINTNSYTLFQFEGEHFIDYSEVPLAIKSFSPEEAYQAIVSSASQLLSNFPCSRLYIISETDEICAEVLNRQMLLEIETIAVDTNKYSKKPVFEVMSSADFRAANSLTLTALGAAYIKSDFNLVMNLLADDPDANLGIYFTTKIFGVPVDVTKEFAQKITAFICIVCIIIFAGLCSVLYLLNNRTESDIAELDSKIQALDQQIAAQSGDDNKQGIDINAIIDEIANSNVSAINFYDSISTDIPKNVWLTKYYNKNGNQIAIFGIAQDIVDIYEYYKNLRVVSPQSDIKLTELKVITPDSELGDNQYITKLLADNKNSDRLYSFEISNTQIQFTKEGEGQGEGQAAGQAPVAPTNENDIIVRPQSAQTPAGGIEQTSQQMKPEG